MATNTFEIQNLKRTMDNTNKILKDMLASLSAPIGASTETSTTATKPSSNTLSPTTGTVGSTGIPSKRDRGYNDWLRETRKKDKILGKLYDNRFFRPLIKSWTTLSNLKIVGAFKSMFQRTSGWISGQLNTIFGEFGEFVELFKGGVQFMWDTAKGIGEIGWKAVSFPFKLFLSTDRNIYKEDKKHTKLLKNIWSALKEGVVTGYKRISLKMPKLKKGKTEGEPESDNTFWIMALVAAGIAFVGKKLYDKWDELTGWVSDTFDGVKVKFEEVKAYVSGMWDKIVKFLGSVGSRGMDTLTTLGKPIAETAGKAVNFMMGIGTKEADASMIPQTISQRTDTSDFKGFGNKYPELTEIQKDALRFNIPSGEGGEKDGKIIINKFNMFGKYQLWDKTANSIADELRSEGMSIEGKAYTKKELDMNPELITKDIRNKYGDILITRHMQKGIVAHKKYSDREFGVQEAVVSQLGEGVSALYAKMQTNKSTYEEEAKKTGKYNTYMRIKEENPSILGRMDGIPTTVDIVNKAIGNSKFRKGNPNISTPTSSSVASTPTQTSTGIVSTPSSSTSSTTTKTEAKKEDDKKKGPSALIDMIMGGVTLFDDIMSAIMDEGQAGEVAKAVTNAKTAAVGAGSSQVDIVEQHTNVIQSRISDIGSMASVTGMTSVLGKNDIRMVIGA